MTVETRVWPQIGWREWIGLPLLGVDAVKAKVDTGARSSSLHAWDIELVPGSTPQRVRFVIHPLERDELLTVHAEAPLIDEREVRSSNGEVELRPVIETAIDVAGRRITSELTLTRRDAMGFRMLLGRAAVRSHFVVNPDDSFLGGGSTVTPPTGVSRTPAVHPPSSVPGLEELEDRHPLPKSNAVLHHPPAGGG